MPLFVDATDDRTSTGGVAVASEAYPSPSSISSSISSNIEEASNGFGRVGFISVRVVGCRTAMVK